jgi:hypothetical protein
VKIWKIAVLSFLAVFVVAPIVLGLLLWLVSGVWNG